jgi:heat shock protein HslJ
MAIEADALRLALPQPDSFVAHALYALMWNAELLILEKIGMHVLCKSLLICLGVSCFLATVSAQTNALDRTALQRARHADLEDHEWYISRFFSDKIEKLPHHGRPQKGAPHTAWPYIAFASGMIEGSPGCGRFTGSYRRSREQLTIFVGWTDEKEKSCGDGEKADAEQILSALTHVQRISVAPESWGSTAILLTDGEGATQIRLSPLQTGKDLSELQDTFWHLTQLGGSNADFSGVVIHIGEEAITFSTFSYFSSSLFQYKLTGLEFRPGHGSSVYGSVNGAVIKSSKSSQDRQIGELFEKVLQKADSYELSRGGLTFFDKDRQPIMALNSVRRRGIENYHWRIAKYRGQVPPDFRPPPGFPPPEVTQQTDKEGLIDAKLADIIFLNGRVRGSTGCGGWEGTYTLSGDQLVFQASFALFGTCEPEGFTQSPLVVNAFKGELRIEEKDDHILLRDKNGKARLLLAP